MCSWHGTSRRSSGLATSDRRSPTVEGFIAAAIALVILFAVGILWGCARQDEQIRVADQTAATPSTMAPTTTIPPPPPLTEAATVTAPAVRDTVQIQVAEPPPAPSPEEVVNGLVYSWGDPGPAMFAYRVVAADYGWDTTTIEARAQFVERIMHGESNFCWNARRWSSATYHLMPCSELRQGVYDDVGFGQITNVLRPLTCEKAGICSIADTIATPWSSMLAYVVVLDELGKRPWCYLQNLHIRNGDCATWTG